MPTREFRHVELSSLSDVDRYEQALRPGDRMCDGNLRSTIKALIMANDIGDGIEEVQAAVCERLRSGRITASQERCR